jgi:hypothetical protein
MTPEEAELALEQRARGSQKARAHVVTLDRCPCCGTRLSVRDVAAIKRGEQSCPNRRPRRASVDVLAAAASALAAHDDLARFAFGKAFPYAAGGSS